MSRVKESIMPINQCEGCIDDYDEYMSICIYSCKRYMNPLYMNPELDRYPDREDKYQKLESSVKTLAKSSQFKS